MISVFVITNHAFRESWNRRRVGQDLPLGCPMASGSADHIAARLDIDLHGMTSQCVACGEGWRPDTLERHLSMNTTIDFHATQHALDDAVIAASL